MLHVFSLQAEALFQPVTNGSIHIKNMAKRYDIAVSFGEMGKFAILNAGNYGSAQFKIEQDNDNKERGYITLNLKAYNIAPKFGDNRRKVVERKSVRIYGPLELLGNLNQDDNELHLDYNQHSRNGYNIGNFKIKFKPDTINKEIELEQLFSAYV
jgi:hypothetical protein